jgi:hypothetical protein
MYDTNVSEGYAAAIVRVNINMSIQAESVRFSR